MTRRKTIVITSLLKPITDPRMYEKMGRSLVKSENYKIYIFGQEIKQLYPETEITFHPHQCAPKLSLKRFLLPFKILFNTIKLKPKLIIVSSVDLLILMVLNKILFGSKIIYDVRENYNYNIRFQSTYSGVKKAIVLSIITITEKLTTLFYDHFFLAETAYFNELNFINKKKTTILQNTCIEELPYCSNTITTKAEEPFLLYTGTIAIEYGVKELINWKLKSQHASKLIIAGFCANIELRAWIQAKTEHRNDIELIGITQLVPHQQIIELIKKATVGIMPYQSNQSINHCIPTKLFEYIYYKLPIIASKNQEWSKIINEYQAGFSVDFNDFNQIEAAISATLKKEKVFYSKKGETNISWISTEEKLLLNTVNSLINS